MSGGALNCIRQHARLNTRRQQNEAVSATPARRAVARTDADAMRTPVLSSSGAQDLAGGCDAAAGGVEYVDFVGRGDRNHWFGDAQAEPEATSRRARRSCNCKPTAS